MEAIEIVPHRPGWAREFEELARGLDDALGSAATRIDHVGSTSVPGLAAKDVLDVQVTLPDWSREAGVRAALESRGYRFQPAVRRDHCPPGIADDPEQWRKLYFDGPPGGRGVHVHVRAAGRANQRYALLFRDYLRAHPRAAAAYAQLKLRLAAVCGADRCTYSEVKDPVCDLVLEAAEAWARSREP